MANSDEDFIGMPPANLSTPNGSNLSDTKFGNPLGNQVDNSSGINNANGSSEGKPAIPGRGIAGVNLGMYSKPSWLCH